MVLTPEEEPENEHQPYTSTVSANSITYGNIAANTVTSHTLEWNPQPLPSCEFCFAAETHTAFNCPRIKRLELDSSGEICCIEFK